MTSMKDLESFSLKLDLSNILLEVSLSVGSPLERASESKAIADLESKFEENSRDGVSFHEARSVLLDP